jgi:hypothetical protein
MFALTLKHSYHVVCHFARRFATRGQADVTNRDHLTSHSYSAWVRSSFSHTSAPCDPAATNNALRRSVFWTSLFQIFSFHVRRGRPACCLGQVATTVFTCTAKAVDAMVKEDDIVVLQAAVLACGNSRKIGNTDIFFRLWT